MLKNIIAGCCFALLSTAASAQTLFTYGHDSVSVKEFLQAYQKNNAGPKDAKALRNYLDLYIASRLKIKEAKEKGYDTLPQLVSDLQSLRAQIVPSYLKDEASVTGLVNEAYVRAQKDIHLAHIFVSFTQEGVLNADAAQKKATNAYNQLQHGEAFATVAKQYSDDPSVKSNGGDLGYITVFSLPYELENLAYKTPVGQTSAVYESKAGYHIFKNLGERKALGRMKAAQILLAFPPESDAATKRQTKRLADSLYNRLLKGDDFGKLAAQFSNDVVSAAANGQLPEFGIGQYDAAFESTVYALPKDGALSKPFETPFGYHIVKRLAKVPAPAKTDTKAMALLRDKVEQSDRMNSTKAALVQSVLQKAHFSKKPFADNELWAYSDSLLDYKSPKVHFTLNSSSPLFQLGQNTVATSDWISYAQTYRYKNDGSGIKPYPQLWSEFVDASALDYYSAHLEQFNEAFRQQINEFKDGNLFFEIMQRQVWNAAQNDTAALQDYFTRHKDKYVWKQSADAVIFYANNTATAQQLKTQLQKAPNRWKTWVADLSDKVAADSARFELAQLPNAAKQPVKAGLLTQPVVNTNDHTASFAYVVRVYTQPAQRSFAEAKGLVINDYQAELEQKWIAELKKKYPVTINQKALAILVK